MLILLIIYLDFFQREKLTWSHLDSFFLLWLSWLYIPSCWYIYYLKKDPSLIFSIIFRAKMSLFGTTSGFGTSGTMFGSTTTDNHNPMKVPRKAHGVCRKSAAGVGHNSDCGENPDSLGASFGMKALKLCLTCCFRRWRTASVCPLASVLFLQLSHYQNHLRYLLRTLAGSQGPAYSCWTSISVGEADDNTC